MQANPTITAVIQLMTLIVALAAVVVLGVDHVLSEATTGSLVGVGLAHAGITAYNGATKGTPQAGVPNMPAGRTITETHTTASAPISAPPQEPPTQAATF